MLLFPQGLFRRAHEYVLAVQLEVDVPGHDEPDKILHVLHNHNKPLRALPSELDFVLEKLIATLKVDLPKQKAKLVGITTVDLGPAKSAFNWENKRQYVDYGVN